MNPPPSTSSSSRRSFLKSSATLAAGLAVAPTLITGCERSASDMPIAADDELLTLFDGTTLDGWHTNREPISHGTGGLWSIEDGALVGQHDPPGSGNGGILLTDRQYGDFELVLDLHPDWGPDSGVFLRATPTGACYQVYVDYHDDAIIGFIYGEGTGAWRTEPFRYDGVLEDGELVDLTMKPFEDFEGYGEHALQYACTAEEWKEAWKIGDFNTLRVRCVGEYPEITTWINGTKICTFDAATHSNPEFDREQVLQTVGREGHIALQVHGGRDWWPEGTKIRWKNIKIREL